MVDTVVKTTVWCTCQFEALHHWPNAHGDVYYLAHMHRHVFHVKVSWIVSHNDRDIEFITAKKKVLQEIQRIKDVCDTSSYSCEHWAAKLMETLGAEEVSVSEDGENGATVCRND